MIEYCAVYGSLRKGMGNHRVIEGCELVGAGRVYGYSLHAYCSGFPAAYESTDGQDSCFVEVYKVDTPSRADRLDGLEGYPSFYNRAVVEVEGVETDGDIWMYFINGKSEGHHIPHGDWVTYKGGEE